jgi:hypothetical protein
MGRHRGEGTGNPRQGEGRHVDRTRQPTGRDPRIIDRASDEYLTGPDNDYDRGDRYGR